MQHLNSLFIPCFWKKRHCFSIWASAWRYKPWETHSHDGIRVCEGISRTRSDRISKESLRVPYPWRETAKDSDTALKTISLTRKGKAFWRAL